jgi:hypothetical protein
MTGLSHLPEVHQEKGTPTMSYDDPYTDDREMMDIPPTEPLGTAPITFFVPIPTMEQVAGEIARQLIAAESYNNKTTIRNKIYTTIEQLISDNISSRATAIINELLDKPLQPTDGFGNPKGEPMSLQEVLAKHIEQWATTTVNRDGLPTKKDGYTHVVTRIDLMLGSIVNAEMKKQMDSEIKNLVATLKDSATKNIAKQIADKLAGMVFK